MQHTAGVGEAESAAEAFDHDEVLGQRVLLSEPLVETDALDQLHHQVWLVLVEAEVVEHDDVGVR